MGMHVVTSWPPDGGDPAGIVAFVEERLEMNGPILFRYILLVEHLAGHNVAEEAAELGEGPRDRHPILHPRSIAEGFCDNNLYVYSSDLPEEVVNSLRETVEAAKERIGHEEIPPSWYRDCGMRLLRPANES